MIYCDPPAFPPNPVSLTIMEGFKLGRLKDSVNSAPLLPFTSQPVELKKYILSVTERVSLNNPQE